MQPDLVLDNKRLTIDVYNTKYDKIPAEFNSESADLILENSDQYYMAIETAQVGLKNAVITNDADLKIGILINKDIPGYDRGYHIYSLTGELVDVQDIEVFLYNTLHKAVPGHDLGTIGLRGDKFVKNITQEVYNNAYANEWIELYCNERMSKLIPQFLESKESTGGYNGLRLWKIRTDITDGVETQDMYTLDKMLDLKRVEFHSSNITVARTTHVQNNNMVENTQKLNIIGTMLVNSEDYDIVNKGNKIYVPTILRYVSMTSNSPLSSFSIQVFLYYKDGTRRRHYLEKGEYMSMQIAFIPLQNK